MNELLPTYLIRVTRQGHTYTVWDCSSSMPQVQAYIQQVSEVLRYGGQVEYLRREGDRLTRLIGFPTK